MQIISADRLVTPPTGPKILNRPASLRLLRVDLFIYILWNRVARSISASAPGSTQVAQIFVASPRIRVNPRPEIGHVQIDADNLCVVVDEFLLNADELVDYAIGHSDRFAVPEKSYPGLQLDIGDSAMAEVYRFFKSEMSARYAFFKGGITFASSLSMVTMQPDQLSNLQRVCHMDPGAPGGHRNYAAVHYLFREPLLGGTGFFRWKDQALMTKATAAELESPEKGAAFMNRHFATFRRPPCYMTETSEIAERIATVKARFNRLIFYPGNIPHNALIDRPELLSDNFATGRLTLNSFALARPV
jgi:hypothetical protein